MQTTFEGISDIAHKTVSAEAPAQIGATERPAPAAQRHTAAINEIIGKVPIGLSLHFTEADSKHANKAWKATCGPHSIAAACGKTLEDVRIAMIAAGVNYRGWMSPTQVTKTLMQLGRPHKLTSGLKTDALCDGINRVQWEGKWLNPGVPARVAYFHTHLVAHFEGLVLCTCCLSAEWIPADDWRAFIPGACYPFHITHHWAFA